VGHRNVYLRQIADGGRLSFTKSKASAVGYGRSSVDARRVELGAALEVSACNEEEDQPEVTSDLDATLELVVPSQPALAIIDHQCSSSAISCAPARRWPLIPFSRSGDKIVGVKN